MIISNIDQTVITMSNRLRFQVLSDIHLEIKLNQKPFSDIIQAECDILLLGGDIGNFDDIELFMQFIEYICSIFKVVIYTFGNHEFFNTVYKDSQNRYSMTEYTIDYFKEMYKGLFNCFENFIILDNEVCTVTDEKSHSYTIVACTLWCDPNENNTELIRLPDFKKIMIYPNEKMNIRSLKETHYNDRLKLYYIVQKCHPDIIITHFPPLSSGITNKNNFGHEYFQNTLLESGQFQEMMNNKPNATTWIYGHTHCNTDFMLTNNIRILSNQYASDDFQKDHVFEHIKRESKL